MNKLGQHFLINKSALRKIAEAVDVRDGDTIIEIGPGHGELTGELLKVVSDMRHGQAGDRADGIRIIAIEKDPQLAEQLRQNLQFSTRQPDGQVSDVQSISNNQFSKLEITEGDIRTLLPQISDELKTKNYKLIGNIPYYLTGYLLRIISELENKPSLCIFTIQKEVAERIVARPPEMNPVRSRDHSQQINETSQRMPNIPDEATSANHRSRSASNGMNKLAASVQFWAEPKILQVLSRRDFKPAPKVDSATLLLTTRKNAAQSGKNAYFSTVKLLFQQPRKTILNNLSTGLPADRHGLPAGQTDAQITREKIEVVCKKTGINPSDRPQNLTVEDIKKLSENIFPLD